MVYMIWFIWYGQLWYDYIQTDLLIKQILDVPFVMTSPNGLFTCGVDVVLVGGFRFSRLEVGDGDPEWWFPWFWLVGIDWDLVLLFISLYFLSARRNSTSFSRNSRELCRVLLATVVLSLPDWWSFCNCTIIFSTFSLCFVISRWRPISSRIHEAKM